MCVFVGGGSAPVCRQVRRNRFGKRRRKRKGERAKQYMVDWRIVAFVKPLDF